MRGLSVLCLTASLLHGASAQSIQPRDDGAFDWTTLTSSTQLNWTTCYDTFQCARLTVPLRYSDPAGDEATVAIIKSPSNLSSTDENYKGPILFNPGGPGGSGVTTVLNSTALFREILGYEFDLIGFDPRGVGHTTPSLSVFSDSVEAGTFFVQWELNLNSTEGSVGRAFAQSAILGKLALERVKDVAETVSTPTVARDMLSIVNAAGLDKLQYWGFSYGSVLGATFASMFPDKIGRMVIDGVQDAEAYYAGNRTSNVLDTDKALTVVLDACVEAGPSLCPIYENSTDLVRSRVNTLLNKMRTDPVPLFNSTAINSAVIDYGTTVDKIMAALFSPYLNGADLTTALAALEKGDGSLTYPGTRPYGFHTLLNNECSSQTAELFVDTGLWSNTAAIECGDIVTDDVQSIDDVRAAYKEIAAVSPHFGGLWLAATLCSGWTIRGGERFNGSFVQNTSFPLMLIGNTADPITPLSGAHKMSQGFTNSVVLAQNSSGHMSIVATSTCTSQAVRAYFVNGTLPEPGTVCEIENTIFPSTSSSQVRAQDLESDNVNEGDESALVKAARSLQIASAVLTRGGIGRRLFY